MMYTAPSAAKFHYTLVVDSSTSEIEVRVFEGQRFDTDAGLKLSCRCYNNKYSSLYLSLDTGADSLEHLETILKIARTVWRKVHGTEAYTKRYAISWVELKAALDSMGAAQMVYDGRVSEYVTRESMKPAEMVRWLNDYDRMGERSCSYDAIAETEEQAQRLIIAEAALNGKGPEWVKKFVEHGMPVKIDTWGKTPHFIDWPNESEVA